MLTILFRTILIYLILIVAVRLMGKRQIGELEISDFVTTLLISEIASLPITDNSIPISHAVIPIVTLVFFEVTSSVLIVFFPRLKNVLTARPSTLIRNGKFCKKAMREARISTEELICELRQKDVTDLSEIEYAILEQSGKISVILKSSCKPPNAEQLGISVRETGIYHIIIDQGVIDRHGLQALQMDNAQLNEILSRHGVKTKDVFLMRINDAGDVEIVRTEDVR